MCVEKYTEKKYKHGKDFRWIRSRANKFVAKQFIGKRGCLRRINQAFFKCNFDPN